MKQSKQYVSSAVVSLCLGLGVWVAQASAQPPAPAMPAPALSPQELAAKNIENRRKMNIDAARNAKLKKEARERVERALLAELAAKYAMCETAAVATP